MTQTLTSVQKWGKRVVFSQTHFFSDYKNVALFVHRAALPCCLCLHKHPMLISSLFAYHFASHWILSATRWKNLSFSKSWQRFQWKGSGFESPPKSGIRRWDSSLKLSFGWVWVPPGERCGFTHSSAEEMDPSPLQPSLWSLARSYTGHSSVLQTARPADSGLEEPARAVSQVPESRSEVLGPRRRVSKM